MPGTLGAVLRNAERGLAETRREIEGMHALSTVPRDPGVIPDLQCFLGCTPRDAVRMSGLDPESAANLSRRINLLLSDKRAPVTCDWNELQKHAGNGTWHHLRGLTYILLRADPSAQVRLIGGERPLWFMNGRLDEEDVRMLVTRFYY
ncbi:MAG: hypothetical protein FJY85_05740 [Deltaproteobacteria bacterium]|nr:hypothetical protein [Deltaproteobacteria bacterium]